MRRTIQILLTCVACFTLVLPISAQQRRKSTTVQAEGVYSNMASTESGDVGGMQVIILSEGIGDAYYAVVQIAEGVPGAPVLVKAKVRGTNIEFTLPAAGEGTEAIRYSGTVTATGLRLKERVGNASTGESIFLKRKNCRV